MSAFVAFPQALLSEVALPLPCVDEYELRAPLLKAYVDDAMLDLTQKERLIPAGAEDMMLNNHHQHIRFMGAALRLRSPALFSMTIPWVYRAYRNHGFSYDYFARALSVWKQSLQACLQDVSASAILPIYDWILSHHQDWIQLAESGDDHDIVVPLADRQEELLEILLAGQHRSALEIMRREVIAPETVAPFYSGVLQPVLYEIGSRWQSGKVSVAEEHVASAIVARMMASMPFVTAPCRAREPMRAIVSTAQQETHELGAWMISDLLHLKQDWDVQYVGADAPIADLIALAEKTRPALIALSVTMIFHIPRIGRLVDELRRRDTLSQTRILVGGQAFAMVPDLWRATHADAFASDIDAALKQTEKWLRDAA